MEPCHDGSDVICSALYTAIIGKGIIGEGISFIIRLRALYTALVVGEGEVI